jgi:hypothetical protein
MLGRPSLPPPPAQWWGPRLCRHRRLDFGSALSIVFNSAIRRSASFAAQASGVGFFILALCVLLGVIIFDVAAMRKNSTI